jgi:hypothetical protein
MSTSTVVRQPRIPLEWLLEGEAFVQYRVKTDLLGHDPASPELAGARAGMISDPRVRAIMQDLAGTPWPVIASHKSAGQPFHRANFLADLGLRADDPGMDSVIDVIMKTRGQNGQFELPSRIGDSREGTRHEVGGWALCDAPLTVGALAAFGLAAHPAVQEAMHFLLGFVRDNGWPCAVSASLAPFRGPGRPSDPCPFATLAMLKALSRFEDSGEFQGVPDAGAAGIECLLSLWEDSRTRHPYIFYMGEDFRKLKAPFIWYDLLHVLDVLSHFETARRDRRYADMLACLMGKADSDGRFTAESVWTAWKGWEFAQKKEASRWLSFLAWRIAQRSGLCLE